MSLHSVPFDTFHGKTLSSAERRKRDLVDLANFGARTGRHWLVRDALHAMRREGLMTSTLAHLVPTELIDNPEQYIAEALRGDECWIVAEAYDALRLESYGFPALATEHLTELTREQLHGAHWVILLQRRGEEHSLAGLDIRGELLRLGWAGRFTAIILPLDLGDAEEEFGADGFGPYLVSLLIDGTSQELAGEQINSVNGEPRRTISEKSGRYPSHISVEVR
jgi:hypothetical protein